MGLKITIEVETPLTKADAESLIAASMLSVSIANGALADQEPDGPDTACSAIDPEAVPEDSFSICTYKKGHEGRHRYVDFGNPPEEES